MTPLRILLFSPRAAETERLLLADSRYYVLDAVDRESDVFARLLKDAPDIALLDDQLPGLNALHVFRRLKNTCAAPPRTVYIGENAAEALALGADAAAEPIAGAKDILVLLDDASLSPLPGLARETASLAAAQARDMLQSLSFPAHLKGTGYLLYSLPMLACNPSPSRLLGKPLYSLIARQFATTPAAAERALRTAIEATWLSGNLSAIAALFGYTVSPEKGKPTNNECLAMLARHVHAKTQNALFSSP